MMLVFIFLLYLSSHSIVIYANPLYQPYAAPSCPCQHNPWHTSDLTFEPTNINPFAIMPQTSTPSSLTSSNNQEYMNKILSNPRIRTILDPNTKLYDQNGFEIPRIIPQNCPNVINNYIIIPPEVLTKQQSLKSNGKRKKNRQGRIIKSRKHNNIENNNHHKKTVTHAPDNYAKSYDDNLIRNNLKINENRNNNFNERRPQVSVKNRNSAGLYKYLNNGGISVKDKENVIRLKIIAHPNNQREEAVIQEFRKKFPGIPEELVKSLLAYFKRKLANGELGIDNKSSDIPTNGKNKKKNNSRSHNQSRKDRRRKGHKQKKGEMNDKTCKTTVEKLLSSVENTEKNITGMNDTMHFKQAEFVCKDSPNILTDNEDTLKTTTTKYVHENNLKTNNFDATSQEPISNNFDQMKVKIEEIEKEQKLNKTGTDEVIDQIFKPNTDGLKLNYNYNVDNTRLPELGAEDAVPITANGIFDDYYPDFRVGNTLAVSDEESLSPNSQSDRYHYTTDSALKIEELSRERRKYEQSYDKNHHTKYTLNEKNIHETENIDDYDEKLSDESDRSDKISVNVEEKSEEIRFKSAPALETPDFETKNVKDFKKFYEEAAKYEPIFKYSDVLDKTSVYSDTKNQKCNKSKPGWKKEKQGDLETVFVRSKVVKYGHNKDDTENLSDDGKDKYSEIVIAESYPDYVW